MDYPYFGFQQPNVGQQMMQPNALFNPATQYQGAMPAGMFGAGAQPNGSVQQGMTPNMAGIGQLGLMGASLMQQAHQQPGQQQQGPQYGGLLNMAAMMNPSLMQGMGQQQMSGGAQQGSQPSGLAEMLMRLMNAQGG
ncbi:hypothetical protein [Burkholderia sp. GbtcB21]|uniref:hypothetical protein n=1 Tax=Burkholderia sp. GbtcB21 TaxID=2824766 RepID=UPI001C30A439|nr:hypothetical protein [Burkholderia sp. GbtcB21]